MLIACMWCSIPLFERRNIFIVTYLLCVQLWIANGEDNSVKLSNQHHSDGRWYDKSKWSNSASTQSSHISNVEGSGASDVVSDLDGNAKGLGPDDEDSDDTGSGNGNVHESPVEGSGAGPVKFEPALDTTTTTTFYMTPLTPSTFNVTSDTSLASSTSFASSSVHSGSQFKHLTAAPATTLSATTLRAGVDIEGISDDDDDDDEEDDDDDDESYDDLEPGVPTPTSSVVDVGHSPPSVDLDHHQPSLTSPTTSTDLQQPTQFEVPPPAVVDVPSATVAPTQRPPHDMYDETAPGDRQAGGGDDVDGRFSFDWLLNPGVLTAVIGGGFVGLLAFILLLMVVVYRMRKKDEGSYVLEEPKAPPTYPYAYQKAPAREFYA